MLAQTDYHIQENSRKCATTGRALAAGEKFYTAIFDECGQFVRRDYSSEAWQGPPPNTFSFWTGKVPPPEPSRHPRIDADVLFDCFRRLDGCHESNRLSFRYVVALLLMRQKRLQFSATNTVDGIETLTLRCPRSGSVFQVVNPGLAETEMSAVQEQVFQLLGWE